MRRFFHSLLLIWRGELPEGNLERAEVRHTDCCAYFPRCSVGARNGHIVATHANDTVFLVHFDDGEYGTRLRSEVEQLFEKEAVR